MVPSQIIGRPSLSPVTVCVHVCVYFQAPTEFDGAEDPSPHSLRNRGFGSGTHVPAAERPKSSLWKRDILGAQAGSAHGPRAQLDKET